MMTTRGETGMKMLLLPCVLSGALLAMSCGGLVLDVGGGETGGAGGSSGGSPGGNLGGSSDGGPGSNLGGSSDGGAVGLPATSGCPTEEEFERYLGDWFAAGAEPTDVGLVPPPRPIRLHIAGASRITGVCGTLKFDEGEPLPPAQHRDEMYPPVPDGPGIGSTLFPGYVYTIISGYPNFGTLDVTTTDKELWKDWCALQEPLFDASGNALPLCLEDGTYLWSGDSCREQGDLSMIYPAARCTNCVRRRVCSCTAQGCSANTTQHRDWSFEYHVESGGWNPTLTLDLGGQVYILEPVAVE